MSISSSLVGSRGQASSHRVRNIGIREGVDGGDGTQKRVWMSERQEKKPLKDKVRQRMGDLCVPIRRVSVLIAQTKARRQNELLKSL